MVKYYLDEDGNVICSDEYLFPENPEDIIDGIYIKDIFYQEPEEIYQEILKENELIHKNLFKGMF